MFKFAIRPMFFLDLHSCPDWQLASLRFLRVHAISVIRVTVSHWQDGFFSSESVDRASDVRRTERRLYLAKNKPGSLGVRVARRDIQYERGPRWHACGLNIVSAY